MTQSIVIGIATVIVLGTSAQWLAWRFRLPSILLLLVFGFLAGPVIGILDPQALQGEWVFAFVSLAVGIILFEAGLSLRVSDLREVGDAVRNLITYGVLITGALVALTAYFVAGFGVEFSILIGAILTVTGPTVVIPLLHHVRPLGRIGTVARWEGVIIDPIGAILSVLVLETILLLNTGEAGGGAVLHAVGGLFMIVFVSIGVSVAGTALLILLLRRRLVPDYLRNAIALMTVVAAFAGANALQHEAGLLTATLMGIMMANQPYVPIRNIGEFKEDLRVLLLAGLFILLSARLELSVLQYVNTRTLAFLAVLILFVRPFQVWASTLGTKLNWKEWAFLSWLAPRGVVAASVAALFGFRLAPLFPQEAARLVPVIFLVIVGTVAIYGLTLGPLARRLGLADQDPQGVLFVGAHTWGRKIARALYDLGVTVLVVDSNALNIRRAREEGLLAEHANALSEDIIDEIDLSGIGRLAALTPNAEVNALAALHFTEVFESADIYQLASRPEHQQEREGDLPRHLRGHLLFGEGITYASLDERFSQGDEVRPFQLSEERTYEALKTRYDDDLLPLFLLRKQDQLSIFAAEKALSPQPGDTLLALVTPRGDEDVWQPETSDTETPEEEHSFDELVERATVLDVDRALSYGALVEQVAEHLSRQIRMPRSAAQLAEQYMSALQGNPPVVLQGAALPHFRLPEIEAPELVLVRCRAGLCISFEDGEAREDGEPIYALFFLVSPEAQPSRHLRILSQLARRIDDAAFLEAWRSAEGEQAIKAVLLERRMEERVKG